MTDIEVEDGEAYYFRYDDDDENIDPDRDFSYIDRKIENVLGQYQKDFMGGVSAESLGARYGGYGSFLPMQQRSPPILSYQKTQSHVNLKSRQDLPSERSNQNSTTPANQIPSSKSIPASVDQSVEAISESRISSMNSQSKPQFSGEFAPNNQIKKPIINQSGKNSLKFRVKMAPDNISCLDNSAIYSGLGLDISPSSSPEGSQSDNDEISAGFQELNVDSPSFIVKIMTSIPLSSDELLSPLQDSLVNMKEKVDHVWTGFSGKKEALPVNIVQENMYVKEKKERKDKKSKVIKDTSKVKRSKEKESSEGIKSKQKAQSQKPVELMKENYEYPANNSSLDATIREDNGPSLTREVVSNAFTSEVGSYSEEKGSATLMNKSSAFKSSMVFDKRNEIGCLGENIDVERKAKDEPLLAKRHVLDDDENGVTSRGRTEDRNSFFVPRSDTFAEKREGVWKEDEANKSSKHYGISKHVVKEEVLESLSHSKDKNAVFIPKNESSSEKRNEVKGKNEAKEFMKQRNVGKDHVKEEVMDSGFVQGKGNGFPKTIEEVGFISLKNEEKDAYNHVSQETKYDDVEKVESLKQKSRSKEVTRATEQGLPIEKDNSSSVVKTKLKDSQVGVSSIEPPRGGLIISSSSSKNEGINSRVNMPPKSNKGDIDQQRKMRKNNDPSSTPNPRKKGKERSSKDLGIGVPEQEAQTLTTKLKDKPSGTKTSSNVGFNNEGDISGFVTEKAPILDVPPVETASQVTYMEDWVECEKCHKWRLLPLGMSAASLTEKIWTCSMITWLPGMNKCSFSEDETTNALRASYIPVDPTIPNNDPIYQDGRASVNVPARPLDVTLPSQATGFDISFVGGKKKNMAKTDINAVRQSSVQDFQIPIKKDQVRSDMKNLKNLKNLKKIPRESDSLRKSGDGRQSKLVKKRSADVDAYGVPKKMKRVHEQSIEACDPTTLRVSQNFAKESPKYPHPKTKIRSQNDMMSKDDGSYNEPGKKRKLKDKDKQQREFSGVLPSNKGGHLVNSWDPEEHSGNEHKNEKKSKPSNFSSLTKGQNRTQSDDAIPNRGGRSEERFHVDRVSRKGPSGRTSEMGLDLGLSDNATTSSSSKISCKVKAKVNEVKSSPVGSSSSSPLKASKPDLNKSTSKKSSSHNECPPSNEYLKDRKSNLSKNSGFISPGDDQFVQKLSSGRHSGAPLKLDDLKDSGGKLDPLFDGTSVQRNSVTKSPHYLHLDGNNTDKGKSHAPKIYSEKEVSSNAYDGREYGKPSRQVVVGHASSRPSHHIGPGPGPATTPSDIEASSSRKKDSLHWAANTALKEAKDLKHNATRLKVSGSGLESTGVSFQAALKFLHGASLLEPGNGESRSGEMTPNEVYTSTAKLCENCALEYERSNDMASAALAYKCMEVAYMRLVYCNNLTASRDRQELQMAVRVAPQVESPSSSASDIDNLNQVAADYVKDGYSAMDLRSHVVSAGNRPNFMRLLDFTQDINLAMEASRRSQSAFATAMPVLAEAGNVEGITSIKRVLDFSFHDVDGFLRLVRLAMDCIKN